MKTAVILAIAFFISLCVQAQSLETYFEKSGGLRTPRYAETVEYCQKLAKVFPQVHYLNFGTSPQGRELPLLIVDRQGNTTPSAVASSGNSVLLVQASIHAGECDGKDAGLMLIRDILTKKELSGLLDHVTILFIPIFNVDGHERFGPYNRINQNGPEEMGWRVTAQNLNLNRDFMKADAPEMQAWLKLYNQWLPDFFVDCHVTDGADYQYVLTYALETQGNMEKNLSDWTAGVCNTYLRQEMEARGYPIFPYVQFRNWHDPRSGLVFWPAPPMLSQGYTLVQNRPGLLIETHMLKPYKTRVEATYSMLELVIRLLDRENTRLEKLESAADEFTSGKQFRSEPFPVSWEESYADSVMSDFKGFEYTMDTSDISGGLWFRYDRTKPATWKIPTFNKSSVAASVNLPEAYIVPPEWGSVIDRLKLHGVRMLKLPKDVTLPVSMSRFSNVKWREGSYEGRHKVSYKVSDSIQTYSFPAGSVLIDMNQRAARVIAHLLEPVSPDSFVSWGFFDAILEQKEYFESYVMETEARKMLAANPALKREFEDKKANDEKFAADPEAILYWFYSRTPWLDTHYDLYPVGRILERSLVEGLER